MQPAPGNLDPSEVGLLGAGDFPAWGQRQTRVDPASVGRPALFGGEATNFRLDPVEFRRRAGAHPRELAAADDANDGEAPGGTQRLTHGREDTRLRRGAPVKVSP